MEKSTVSFAFFASSGAASCHTSASGGLLGPGWSVTFALRPPSKARSASAAFKDTPSTAPSMSRVFFLPCCTSTPPSVTRASSDSAEHSTRSAVIFLPAGTFTVATMGLFSRFTRLRSKARASPAAFGFPCGADRLLISNGCHATRCFTSRSAHARTSASAIFCLASLSCKSATCFCRGFTRRSMSGDGIVMESCVPSPCSPTFAKNALRL